MKRILFISALNIWSMGSGKGAPSLWRTLKVYADNGWKVVFITTDRTGNFPQEFYNNLEVVRFSTRWIPNNRYFNKTIFWLYFQIMAFIKGFLIAKRSKVDVFYGYEVHGVPAAKLLSCVFKKPFISRFQGTKLSFYLKDRFWKIRFWDDVLAFRTPSDILIMTNDGTQGDQVLKAAGVRRDIKFWINGVNKNICIPDFDKNEFKRQLGFEQEDKILLAVSRLEKWKGVERIIYAMQGIVKEYPGVKLLIAGDGQYAECLKYMTRQLSLNSFVHFTGSLPHKELIKYYNAADIFVSMYDISNVGNPLLEAMSCGKCIVTLNNGDTHKYIQNGHNGILLDIQQLTSLPQIIAELLKNERERLRLGDEAKNFAMNSFWTWEERMQTELQTTEKLLN